MIKSVNCTSFKIERLQTDNGAEFKNTFLSTFLEGCGNIHETSIPYEHHQNGNIEWMDCSISEISQTMLIASCLPKELWPYAFCHAAWIFNRTMHGNDTIAPYEVIAKNKPSLLLLCVFGSKGYLYDHLFQKDLSEKAIFGYHLGEAPHSKGWLFWIPDRKKVLKGASVKFDKNCFIQRIPASTSSLSLIQASSIFDGSMILAIEKQDKLVSSVNVSHDPIHVTPINYREALASAEANEWNIAIEEELTSIN
ncbi:hypothetical protein O181_008596 [Austropuccinia psidii MF-1]|uniref:Integrase catalytic domain-containing protein n=1 Tax=Austropuccinia psidii MF-1 TaxID=1389203 RepID=A0A9Q3GIN8_9BASI|nr:hypothetical protein [Austropuccinia psidii MF-1]